MVVNILFSEVQAKSQKAVRTVDSSPRASFESESCTLQRDTTDSLTKWHHLFMLEGRPKQCVYNGTVFDWSGK